jgi:DedD protein
MDSRAKQRLTGAVILVALFVLLVPALLTGPTSDRAQGDAADEGLRRYTIDLDAPATSGAATPAAPGVNLPPVAEPGPVESPAAGSGSLARPGESAAPESAAVMPEAGKPRPVASPPVPAQAAPRPSVAASPAPPPAPVSTAATPQSAPRADTRKPAAVTPPAGSFVVQLGSFGSKENAERLVRDMTAKGFATFIAPITTNGRDLYRVRVGPTRDRASAEALAAQLKRIGQSGSIVPIS